ncbi:MULTISPECIES: cytidine deaminase [unclassified Corynebacterium]|uniref:cytidine deaminase n=1 Tax=unclassified Corynebacterium TaxID=2624378 RepID=UPI0029CA6886|nr:MULTISPECIES: cytidine deaminase [unclassified Corynebacterium]WPF65353.1 cytidine deaminase [Corynebacterium sp. 22KM0430]WPF67848.1 cytidine deaminase [Corynebacterium sp. 21KM1197]
MTSPPSPDTARRLLHAARDAARRAWVPYSHFPVGTAVLTAEDRVISGCNVENAAYGEAICAERNAVTSMVATTERPEGAAPPAIAAVAVVGLRAAPCWPCGACRQVLREFHCRYVIVEDASGEPIIVDFEEILPHSFGPEALSSAPKNPPQNQGE